MNQRMKKKQMKPQIKVKGKCPICGGKMSWRRYFAIFSYGTSSDEFPMCENDKCDLSNGYGSDIKYHMVNHRTAKIDGLWGWEE